MADYATGFEPLVKSSLLLLLFRIRLKFLSEAIFREIVFFSFPADSKLSISSD